MSECSNILTMCVQRQVTLQDMASNNCTLQYTRVPLQSLFKPPDTPLCIHPTTPGASESSFLTDSQSVLNGQVSSTSCISLKRMPSFSESSFSSFPAFYKYSPNIPTTLPMLHCILFYDIQTFSFSVTIVKGHHFETDDVEMRGISRPYVSLYLLPHKEEIYRTKTIIAGTNVVEFNEAFHFHNIPYGEIGLRTLVLSVYNERRLARNHLLGTAQLPLNKTELYGVEVSVVLNSTLNLDNVSTCFTTQC